MDRQLAESTSTALLDELIALNPHRLEFYRTRGIVHCFRDEYALAAKDFTHALKEARVMRKARTVHLNGNFGDKQRGKGAKKKKGKAGGSKTNGQAPPDGTSVGAEGTDAVAFDGPDGETIMLHPSVLPDAPEPIEPQCLFLRAAAYLQHAVFLIEDAIFKLEGIQKIPSIDGAEMRLCYVENGRYGGVEIGNPDGPLGKGDGAKLQAYRAALTAPLLREHVLTLVRKSMRDHRQFLAHFDTLEGGPGFADADIAQRTEYAFLLSESLRPGSQSPPPPVPDTPPVFTTYHPLPVEHHLRPVGRCKERHAAASAQTSTGAPSESEARRVRRAGSPLRRLLGTLEAYQRFVNGPDTHGPMTVSCPPALGARPAVRRRPVR